MYLVVFKIDGNMSQQILIDKRYKNTMLAEIFSVEFNSKVDD